MPDSPLPPEASAQPARPLHVTIGLLLLWTATTAMALGLATSLQRTRDAATDAHLYPQSYRRMLWAQDLLWFLAAPAYGAVLAAAVIAAYRAVRQEPGFPAQPGHWIAVQLGIGTLGFFVTMIPDSDDSTQRMIATAVIATLAVAGCLAVSSTRHPRRWRAALFVNAGGLCSLIAVMIAGRAAELDTASPALWMLLVLPALAIIVAIVLAAVATAVDLVQPPRQDFFHWVGLIALAVLVAHPTMAIGLLWYY